MEGCLGQLCSRGFIIASGKLLLQAVIEVSRAELYSLGNVILLILIQMNLSLEGHMCYWTV